MLERGGRHGKFHSPLIALTGEQCVNQTAAEAVAATHAVNDMQVIFFGEMVFIADSVKQHGAPTVVGRRAGLAQRDSDLFKAKPISKLSCNGLVALAVDLAGIDIGRLPVYMTAETWQAIGRKVEGFQDRFVRLTRRVGLKDIQVIPFAISHDAVRPVGYTVCHGESKITLATDLGCVSPDVAAAAAYADILILEANHDEGMVRNGPYPYPLQQRILGRWGHLSNKTAAAFLAGLPTKGVMRVLLAHRSEKNNTPALALHTMRTILSQAGRVIGQDILLRLACQKGSVRFQERSHEL